MSEAGSCLSIQLILAALYCVMLQLHTLLTVLAERGSK